ncbi:hypothetical protein CLV58_101214 [Spirosoma oryzae]|uniref:Uncharacterized protein n=1 Tax=Spirosoma oryzae TaxID=1469603 RepID=A0A2T0TNP1_9BACT|nr:hypothetical protein CLV58_101214 [Spirosoma oryzae]
MSNQPTVKDHYNRLKTRDLGRFNEFNAELARRQKFNSFIRNVCNNPKKNLQKVDCVIGPLMITYLGFTQENFDTNTIPALPGNVVELNSGSDDLRKAA